MICPLSKRRRVSATGSPPQLSQTRGPHAGHAIGWAWKRRSDGSSYSAAQAGHNPNVRIVVVARSYGMASMIDRRGPQCVQLVNG
jgi:hypothetical protein